MITIAAMAAAGVLLAVTEAHAQGVVVRVGQDSGDVVGADSFALQRAADEIARRAPAGGGTLLIGAGTYTMYDSLHVPVPMTIRGQGQKTILRKCAQVRTKLLQDFDLSEYIMKVESSRGLRVGMGITLKDSAQQSGWDCSVRTIVAINGQEVRLDRRPERDYGLAQGAWAQNSFPLISVRQIDGVVVEDLMTDGNLEENRDVNLDGCRSGGIYFHDVRNCTVRRSVARNGNGDGISWQTTEDMLVEDCEAYGNTGLGLHPGTGSPRTTVRNCRAHNNGQVGLFLCWGVRFSRFENNILEDNPVGISIGHKDADNLFINNQVRHNTRFGVLFRNEHETTAGHRCTFRSNVIEDNALGMQIDGTTRGTVLEENVIRDTRPAAERKQTVAISVGANAEEPHIAPSNRIEGEVRSAAKRPATKP